MASSLQVWLVFGLVLLTWRCSTLPNTTAMPPPSPVSCNATGCTLSNAYGVWNDRKECRVPSVTYPTTEEELRLAVAQANKKKLKVKIVTGSSHSIPKLACPSDETVLVQSKEYHENSMLISTAKYNTGIEVDVKNMIVTADSGVGLRDLIDKVEETGLSLVTSPYWEGLSIGGLLSTGAHGSSWWEKGGAVHEHVVGLSFVVPACKSEGYAKIIRLDAHNPLFNAAKVSLGMLGAISKVKLSLEAGFKRSITNIFKDDTHLEDDFMDFARKHEFADITWYPSKTTAVYRQDDRVPLSSSGEGINDFVGFQPTPVPISTNLRATEKAMETARNSEGKCTLAASLIASKKSIAYGLKNNNQNFTGYPVVGRQGRMQTSGSCLYAPSTQITCTWDPRIKGLFFYDIGAVFPASKFGDFIRDVKKLRNQKPENFCGIDIYTGFLIRFIKASKAYLGHSEDSVAVDFTYYRADEQSTLRLNQDVWEEVEQMAFFKYGAKPHWGKNRDVAFLGVQDKYPKFHKFLAAKKKLDPQNMFSSNWLDGIFFGGEKRKAKGCAMEGQCICSEDRHCNPKEGLFCRPGLVFNQAKVCRQQ